MTKRDGQIKLFGQHLQIGSKIKGLPGEFGVILTNLSGLFNEIIINITAPEQISAIAAELAIDHLKPRGLWVEDPHYYDRQEQPLTYLSEHGLGGPNPAQGAAEQEQIWSIEWTVIPLKQ